MTCTANFGNWQIICGGAGILSVISYFVTLIRFAGGKLDHNAVALLREMTPEQLAERASELVLHSRINYAYRRLQEYLAETRTLGRANQRGCARSEAGCLFFC